MLKLQGCLPGLVDEAKCRHAVDIMLWEAQMVHDYPEYRTLGNDAENPRCMNIAKTKTIEGKKNCFPVWLGSTQKIKDIDQYLWLAKENAECTSSVGTVFTGEACTPNLPPSVCTSKLQQRIIAADDAFKKKPYPVDQWKCYSTWTYKRAAS